MSQYNIQNVNDDISGILHGKTGNKVTNFFGVCRRAANNLLANINPAETRRYAQITLYDQVNNYAIPMDDLKESAIFDIRPQVNRHRSDNLSSRFSKEFDQKKWDNWFSIEDDHGTKYIRVSKRLNPGAAGIDPLDDMTGWTASGNASNLLLDRIYSITNGNSLRIDLAAAGSSGLLTKSTITTQDLSDWETSSSFFLWVYLPTASTNITGVNLRIGSSATKYWEMAGVIHFGAQTIGWNLFRFDWSGATKTSTPDSSALTYVRIELTYGGTAVLGIRLDQLFSSLPKIWEIGYYSKFLFSNAGTWQDTVTDLSTTINLDVASYPIYINEVALEAVQQVQGKDAQADKDFIYKKLYTGVGDQQSLYASYKENNPNQREKVTQTTYTNLRFKRK